MIDFIGIGAQKSGTSWTYTCLYEHPEVCAPIKELHFFSRPRWSEGKEWYERHFGSCAGSRKRGEFSTSYLYSKDAPERIHSLYPGVQLIVILRNPIDRAYSQYRNAIKAGEIQESISFETYQNNEPSALEQGRYSEQLERYFKYFTREQMLILIYEDIRKDPVAFMRNIYEFLGIDTAFVSSMVHDEINVARTPKHVFLDRIMHHTAETLRKIGFDRLVHTIRRSGLPERVRSINTKSGSASHHTKSYDREELKMYFHDDVAKLSRHIGRDLNALWQI